MNKADTETSTRGGFFTTRRLILLAGNLVFFYFLARWTIRNIEWSVLIHYFGRISPQDILLSLSINFVALLLYSLRMRILLGRRVFDAFAIVNLGYALNSILPFRLGDASKIYLCHKLFGIRISELLGTTVAEKVIDLAMVLALGGFVAAVSTSSLVGTNVLVPLAILMFCALMGALLFRLYLARFVHMLPKGGGLRRGVIALHRQLRNYRIVPILATTALIWTLNVTLAFVTFSRFLPGTHVGILDAIVLLVITVLAIAAPSAPAGAGLFEAGIIVYLHNRLGVGNEAALAVATVFHMIVYVPQGIISLVLLQFLPDKKS